MLVPFSLLIFAASPVAFDPRTGATTIERGLLSTPLTGELSSAARAWALSKRRELQLPADSTLVNAESFGTRFGASFHLQQQIDGLDVYGANAVVTIDKNARVVLLTSSVFAYEQVRKAWVIDEREAVARAARSVLLPKLNPDGSVVGVAKRAYFRVADEAHAGWLVHVPSLDVRQNMYVAIDAASGETLQKWNRVFTAALDANVYRTSPGGLDAGVGVTPTIKVSLTHADAGSMLSPSAQGVLEGTQLDAFNCCVYRDCNRDAPDAGPKRAVGQTMFGNFTINYNVVTCDFRHRANNDAGSFEYQPVDPPQPGAFTLSDPANSDEFSEVQGFYQVNKAYDWVRGLSRSAAPLFPNNQPAIVPFAMRDERRVPARRPALWANVVFPDFQAIFANPACVLTGTPCVIDNFTRLDNAAFIARENFAQIPIADLRNDVDTMMIFQGPRADFGYDSPVVWHEFGHGVIYSTANLGFDALAIDARSANNESGALHEGLSDYLSGAFGGETSMGQYVGPRLGQGGGMMGIRTDSYLRSLENTLSCPDVLHGEVHDDSQHVSAALWRARQDRFLGSDNGATFDATLYATLVSVANTAGFDHLAAVMEAHVNSAFPDGGPALAAIFDQRGVTHCSKVVDMTGAPPRPLYGIGGTMQAGIGSGVVPGPHQMKVKVPNGAKSVAVTAQVSAGGFGLGMAPVTLRVLARAGSPITFVRSGGGLQNDATHPVDLAVNQGVGRATVAIDVPCGPSSEVYLTVANAGTDPVTLQNLTLTVTAADSCARDGGTDGGSGKPDGGSMVVVIPGIQSDGGPPGVFEGPGRGGCGCDAGLGAGAGAWLLLLWSIGRRARRRRE